jgi:predicted site-specific integrase-resolvase
MSALTPKQVAEKYGVSVHTCLHWLATGQLKALNVGRSPGKEKTTLEDSARAPCGV